MPFFLLLALQDFRESRIEAGYIDELVVEDMDGDGAREILIQDGFELRTFRRAAGGFQMDPKATIRLGEDVFLWTLARGPAGAPELLAMGPRGVRKAGSGDLVTVPTLFEGRPGLSHPPVRFDFAPDVDGDGTSELAVFLESGVGLFARRDGLYRMQRLFRLAAEPVAEVPHWPGRPVVSGVRLPYLLWRDMDANGRLDLAARTGRGLQVFVQDAGGFRAEPVELESLRIRRWRRGGYARFDVEPILEDVTGDGVVDIVTTDPSRGRVWIHYGRAGRVDAGAPDAEREIADSWCVGVFAARPAGKPVLVVWVVEKLGLFSGMSAFANRHVASRLLFFPPEGQGVSRQASSELPFELSFTLSPTREYVEFRSGFEPALDGDVDGDGVRDLVIVQGEHVVVHRGTPDGRGVERRPWASLKLERMHPGAPVTLRMADLDGDGRAEILAWTFSRESERSRVQIWSAAP